MKKLLTYGFNTLDNKYNDIKNSAKKFGIEVLEIKDNEIGEKVGALLELEGFEKKGTLASNIEKIEFFLFSDFDREILRDFIVDLKNKEIVVEHKSVVTETTKNWTFEYLVNHIKEEHQLVVSFNKLGKLVKEASNMLQENYSKELEDAIDFCLSARELTDIGMEDVEVRYNKLLKIMGEANE